MLSPGIVKVTADFFFFRRLDDIEDDSPLRRGFPSTHVVYGISQTINSANYLYVMALEMTQRLNSPACLNVFIGECDLCLLSNQVD
jgi:geranylgeranyl pyrophosphate synthase